MHGDLKSHDRQLALSVWFLLQQSWRFGRDETTQRPRGARGRADADRFADGVPPSTRWRDAALHRCPAPGGYPCDCEQPETQLCLWPEGDASPQQPPLDVEARADGEGQRGGEALHGEAPPDAEAIAAFGTTHWPRDSGNGWGP